MLKVIRGDTSKFKFSRKDSEGNTIMQQANAIYFTIKNDCFTKQVLIQKTIDDMTFENGVYTFTIDGTDTDNLNYGFYRYDLEVVEEEYKQTISIGDFVIEEEVTFTSNESGE